MQRLRGLQPFLIASGMAVSLLASAASAQIVDEPGLRTGMTWSLLESSGGYAHAGSDGQTNPYSGDTTVDQFLPILCLLVDNRPAPGIPFDFYNGWARGGVQVTAPVKGAALTSREEADRLCALSFGTGWRMAEFHDGRYGGDFSLIGGWSFWAAGQLTSGSRFWVAIDDQPANPWNSAGEMPPAGGSDADFIVKTRLHELVAPLLGFAQNPQFRAIVYSRVGQQFDGDDNALLSTIIGDVQQSQVLDTSSPEWQAFVAKVAAFGNINGEAYYPQLYLPNFGVVPNANGAVTMVALETDLSRTQLTGYEITPGGEVHIKPGLVDENTTDVSEVWVVSVNERIESTPEELAFYRAVDEKLAEETDRAADDEESASLSYRGPICNPTGLRNDRGMEYLQKFKIPDPSAVEHWTAGKLEPRVVVVGKGGVEIKNANFGKIKRKTIKNWVTQDLFLTTWDKATLGDFWAFKWIEIDGGPKIELSLGFSATILKKLGLTANASVKATFEKKFDDMGAALVGFDESTYIEYSTGIVFWTECSVGGIGGTGNDNLALAAIAAASSTYPFEGYSPSRVNDGNQSTAIGGATSWVNADRYASNGFLPQWVQLDFGVNQTFTRVVVFTTAGYPIRDFQLQVWNGITWTTIAQVLNNTATSVTLNVPATTSRLVRILGTRGPAIQPQYVRINEFEVYR